MESTQQYYIPAAVVVMFLCGVYTTILPAEVVVMFLCGVYTTILSAAVVVMFLCGVYTTLLPYPPQSNIESIMSNLAAPEHHPGEMKPRLVPLHPLSTLRKVKLRFDYFTPSLHY